MDREQRAWRTREIVPPRETEKNLVFDMLYWEFIRLFSLLTRNVPSDDEREETTEFTG